MTCATAEQGHARSRKQAIRVHLGLGHWNVHGIKLFLEGWLQAQYCDLIVQIYRVRVYPVLGLKIDLAHHFIRPSLEQLAYAAEYQVVNGIWIWEQFPLWRRLIQQPVPEMRPGVVCHQL